MKKTLTILVLIFLGWSAQAQIEKLKAGPMLGYSEMEEVLIWVQTKEAAKIEIEYWEAEIKNAKKQKTIPAFTKARDAFTAKLIANKVEPGKKYYYTLYIDEQKISLDYPTFFQTQALWQWRTDPPNFKVALGSCTYVSDEQYDRPGKPYGGDYQIFSNIHKHQPDLMLWLGDNVYFREADWYSRTGILRRYTHTRSLAEMQSLLASTHHYAIWDDHDFGPNDSDRGFIHKDKAKEAFELFWGNPTFGIPQSPEGITTQFKWADVDFFLLDDRYYRSPNNCKSCEPTILGKEQLEWLVDALVFSKATFKIVAVGGQVLNTAELYENYSHKHADERAYLLKRIEEENLKNVIFVTGDRHHTELSKVTNRAGHTIYDLTISPLTSGAGINEAEVNHNLVEGTLVGERNFGILEFSGTRENRKIEITVLDSDGKTLWTHDITAEEK